MGINVAKKILVKSKTEAKRQEKRRLKRQEKRLVKRQAKELVRVSGATPVLSPEIPILEPSNQK
jgi:uncharacterized Fe-S cluster-containing radical SAM superfamily protein